MMALMGAAMWGTVVVAADDTATLPPKYQLHLKPWGGDILSVSTGTPPAALLVIAPDGRRAGADPGAPLTVNGLGTELNEFEDGEVEQQNISNDDPTQPEEPSEHTGWCVNIRDEVPHAYTV